MKLSDSIGILDQFSKIDLASMDSVSLMNRMDSKYIVSGHRLPEILERVKPHYRLLEVEGLTCQPYETRYYDTQAYYFFRQHVTGSPIRYKVRFSECIRNQGSGSSITGWETQVISTARSG